MLVFGSGLEISLKIANGTVYIPKRIFIFFLKASEGNRLITSIMISLKIKIIELKTNRIRYQSVKNECFEFWTGDSNE